jgi:hypothetical protein
MMSAFDVFLWASFGGAFFELLHWAGLKQKKHFPVYAGSPKYWAITGLMIIFGAMFADAVFLSGNVLTPLTATILGYSAPSIIQKLATTARPPVLGTSDGEVRPSIFSFLVG